MIQRYAITLMAMAVLMGVISVSLVRADTSYTIDFEGLPEGMVLSELSCGAGMTCPGGDPGHSVPVFGHNPIFAGTNAAMVFDAECDGGCSGGDTDLLFPGHGNTLIVSEDLNSSNPDDADVIGSFFEFDFSAFGPGGVTVNSIDAGDIETEEDEGGAFVEATDGPCVGIETGLDDIPLPFTGDNLMQIVDLQMSNVHCLHVHLNGSGTIDNIQFTAGETPAPAITIEKATNGEDADEPTGPVVPVGSTVSFTYVVTNTGNEDLDNVSVEDDQGVVVTCPQDTLTAGESMTCTGSATASPGQYANVGTACGDGAVTNQNVCDSDPSHHFGADPVIDIEKWTRIVAAPAGGDVCDTIGKPQFITMRYTGGDTQNHSQDSGKVEVTGNPGTASPVYIIAAKESDGEGGRFFEGTVTLGQDLVIDGSSEKLGSSTYTLIFDAPNGTLLQTVLFHTSCSQPLNLGDQYGAAQLIGITDKDGQDTGTFDPGTGFGEDADSPTGPSGPAGAEVVWTYFVTNPGDAPLRNVVVTDDNGTPGNTSDDFSPDFVSGDTNGDDLLDLTETWLYQARGTVQQGQYRNDSTVSGVDPNGTTVTDQDPSHHIGTFQAGDICEGKGKPETLTMIYTGHNVQDHTQNADKVKISGDPMGALVVHIISAEKEDGSGNVYFDGTVNLGESFVIDGSAGLKSETFVLILDESNQVLQTINFHTSCSQPLELGDQFGGIQLIGFTGQEDGKGKDGKGKDDKKHDKKDDKKGQDQGLQVADVCQTLGKPQSLTMLYTGGSVQDHGQKADKVNVSGDPGSASPVRIISSEKADGTGKTYFDGTVNLGESFVIDGSHSKLKAKTFVLVFDGSSNLLQTIEFHTSCSQPLVLGDQFGGIQLIEFTSTG